MQSAVGLALRVICRGLGLDLGVGLILSLREVLGARRQGNSECEDYQHA